MIDTVLAIILTAFAVVIVAGLAMAVSALAKQKAKVAEYKEKYEKELHHRKSSEIRLGKIGENLAPFVSDWPWDPNRFRFLGNPVDGVQFNNDEIIFVEIKTGRARLSKSQKRFRDLVKTGNISFVTFKITEEGTKLVKEN